MNKENLQTELIETSDYWESAWSRAQQESLFRRTSKDPVPFWNKRAANFSKNTTGNKGEKRVQKIMGWLEQEGVDLTGGKVLDIGAGPGSFAVPMAKLAQQVVALEPSDQMVALLKDYAKDNMLENIQVIPEKWDSGIDIKARGLEGEFDLVFSSMNPGIIDGDTLEKALSCSKKYCYISNFAGKRDNPALQELWQLIYNEPMPPWPGDIFYIANLLYTRGYQFSFKVWEEINREELSEEEATVFLIEMLDRFGTKPREEMLGRVKEYVKAIAVDGKVSQLITTRIGKILVRL